MILGDSNVTESKSNLNTPKPIISSAKLENSASRSITTWPSLAVSCSSLDIVLSEHLVNILTIASMNKAWNPGVITAEHKEWISCATSKILFEMHTWSSNNL